MLTDPKGNKIYVTNFPDKFIHKIASVPKNSKIKSVAWNTQGTQIAIAVNNCILILQPYLMENINKNIIENTKIIHTLKRQNNKNDEVLALAWSTGELLAASYRDGTISIWNTKTGNLITTFEPEELLEPKTLAWSSGERWLVAGSPKQQMIEIWEVTKFDHQKFGQSQIG